MPGISPVNTGDPDLEYAFYLAERRVLEIQAKLHRWARDDPHRRFDDLFNLVADPAFLLVGWARVRGSKGAKTAGVDGRTAVSIEARGVEEFLGALRDCLKDRSFCPLPSRERLIPKPGTAKRRRLGISTIRDRVVQASLKLVLEPIFEADFHPLLAAALSAHGSAAFDLHVPAGLDGDAVEVAAGQALPLSRLVRRLASASMVSSSSASILACRSAACWARKLAASRSHRADACCSCSAAWCPAW